MTRSFGTFGLWGGMWIKGTVMYAYTNLNRLTISQFMSKKFYLVYN